MRYDLFLFDLDDTLLDFKESERLSFYSTLLDLGLKEGLDLLFAQYQIGNRELWRLFEQGQTTQAHLKVERFRRLFDANQIEVDPELASTLYLETLPKTVVLIDHAVELCQQLSQVAEIGIITNGIQSVQAPRINNSKLAPYISFVGVSEACGFAKPDHRFFEYTVKLASRFNQASTLLVGDRLETDIQGAHAFGIDSCWFNPHGQLNSLSQPPTWEVRHLSEVPR